LKKYEALVINNCFWLKTKIDFFCKDTKKFSVVSYQLSDFLYLCKIIMKKTLLLIVLFFATKTHAEISILQPLTFEMDTNSQLKEKDPVIAWLISFPTGMLGLHRAYLGTSTTTVILYIVTAGGILGIVPMIDWILLLRGIQDGDISRFVGNRRFVMWL